MDREEIIIEENNNEGLPGIKRVGNEYTMTKFSIPLFADVQFAYFFQCVNETLSSEKEINFNIKLGYFNTKSELVLKELFERLSRCSHKCKSIINWHYLPNDEDMMEHGEMKQQDYPKLKFNLIEDKK